MIWASQSQTNEPDYFYFDLIRKYVVVFGRTFSDIVIQRTTANNIVTDIKVPLTYAPKDKTIVALEADPDLDRPFSVLLPQMSFEIAPPGIAYDSSRKLSTTQKNVVRNAANTNSFQIQYAAAPYNIFFNLYIYVKNQEDGTKILEQILPFFQPDWVPTIELIPSMNEVRDIPIEIIPQMGYQDLYDEKLTKSRMILYTLSFRMRAYFWGPVRAKPMIKFGQVNMRPGQYTNNSVTLNYINLVGNRGFQTNSSIYAYANNGLSIWTGTIVSVNTVNTTSGTLVVSNVSGNLTVTTIYSSANVLVANLTSVNGFSNGVYTNNGLFIPNNPTQEYVYFQPGLTANGQPTNIVNNSVSWTVIDIEDDYGFATETESTLPD